MLVDFQSFPLYLNLIVFIIAGGIIWFVGTRAALYADIIADRTGLGSAFVGLVFLALATETPEIATTITAASLGNAPLAVNNLFGGVVTQTVMLVVADVLLRGNTLTYFTPQPVLALQAQLLIVLLGLSSGLMLVGELVAIGHVGLWTPLLLGGYIFALYITRQFERRDQPWQPSEAPEGAVENSEQQEQPNQDRFAEASTKRIGLLFVVISLVILAAGYVLAQTADALAVQSGLGASFLGATLLAFSTSLPELSTVVAAIRIGNSSMAMSNIFGSNLIMIALLFLTDLFYLEGPVLQDPQASTIFAALMGIVVTAVYLAGLTERRNQMVLGMGLDSLAVLVFYLVTLVGLYILR